MKLLQDCWVALVELLNVFTLSPSAGQPHSQHVLNTDLGVASPQTGNDGPIFVPPSRPQHPGEVLKCDYSTMGREWQSCSTPHSRACWLAGPGGKEFNIQTDYESDVPTGTLRKVRMFQRNPIRLTEACSLIMKSCSIPS